MSVTVIDLSHCPCCSSSSSSSSAPSYSDRQSEDVSMSETDGESSSSSSSGSLISSSSLSSSSLSSGSSGSSSDSLAGDSCCDALPYKLYATVTWCGTSVIALYENVGACPSARIWRGTGVFGGGPGTAELVLRCDANGLTLLFDACTGVIGDVCTASGQQGTCDPFFLNATDAPPSACGSCMTSYEITLSV